MMVNERIQCRHILRHSKRTEILQKIERRGGGRGGRERERDARGGREAEEWRGGGGRQEGRRGKERVRWGRVGANEEEEGRKTKRNIGGRRRKGGG